MFLIRRLVWFATGVTAGFGGAMWIRRRLLRALERYVPEHVAAEVSTSVRRIGTEVRDAVGEGRAAMRDREARLRSELRPGSPAPSVRRNREHTSGHVVQAATDHPGRTRSSPLG
jgi:hypothetical protein